MPSSFGPLDRRAGAHDAFGLAGGHPPAPDPVLEGTRGDPELTGQLRFPPLVRAKPGPVDGVRPAAVQPQPSAQLADARR